MIDFTEIDYKSDGWELFARDYLVESGFFIDSTVNRGPDQGKDMLVIEHLRGLVGKYQMRWLVSCKHFAKSKKSVSETEEQNILERIKHFQADGFIGFYSTLAATGLSSRLDALKKNGEVEDFRIFDGKLIENALVTVGYSHLMMRYFPKSYEIVKPLHLITSQYEPLSCEVCGKDLLRKLMVTENAGNLVYVEDMAAGPPTKYYAVYAVCRGECDDVIQDRAKAMKRMTGWKSLQDLIIPVEFLRYVLTTVNRIRDGNDVYTDEAYAQEKAIMISLAQKVLRMTTERERDRFAELVSTPIY